MLTDWGYDAIYVAFFEKICRTRSGSADIFFIFSSNLRLLVNREVVHKLLNLIYDRILEAHEYACKNYNDTKNNQYGDEVGVTLLDPLIPTGNFKVT